MRHYPFDDEGTCGGDRFGHWSILFNRDSRRSNRFCQKAPYRSHGDGTQHVWRPSRPLGCREAVEWLVGVNPPFHHPVFVLTHHARKPLELEGGTTFTFVTDGIEAALDQAQRAARGKDVSLAGGASAAQQYLATGLVDEMEISVVPTLLGSGARLFDGAGDDLHGLQLIRTVAAPTVTHLKFARR